MIANDPKVEVWAIPVKGGGSRAFCDRMNSWAQSQGQPGLGYIYFSNSTDSAVTVFDAVTGKTTDGYQESAFAPKLVILDDNGLEVAKALGPIAKNIGEERTIALRKQLSLGVGDAAFFVAGIPSKFYKFAGEARTKAGEDMNLIAKDRWDLCWIVDFPMYEWNEDEKKIDFSHNPFSMPQGGLEALTSQDPLTINAYQYDIVCNGVELSSGAIRNHKPEVMKKAFEIAGYPEAVILEKFGGMYRAFQYGAPPHGGIAPGVVQ
jgi:aspartyl-tRNA synthetase